MMRKYLYFITHHENSDRVGDCKIMDKQLSWPLKNREGPIIRFNEEREVYQHIGRMVGLGSADFEDVDDFQDRISDVIEDKLIESDY